MDVHFLPVVVENVLVERIHGSIFVYKCGNSVCDAQNRKREIYS